MIWGKPTEHEKVVAHEALEEYIHAMVSLEYTMKEVGAPARAMEYKRKRVIARRLLDSLPFLTHEELDWT